MIKMLFQCSKLNQKSTNGQAWGAPGLFEHFDDRQSHFFVLGTSVWPPRSSLSSNNSAKDTFPNNLETAHWLGRPRWVTHWEAIFTFGWLQESICITWRYLEWWPNFMTNLVNLDKSKHELHIFRDDSESTYGFTICAPYAISNRKIPLFAHRNSRLAPKKLGTLPRLALFAMNIAPLTKVILHWFYDCTILGNVTAFSPPNPEIFWVLSSSWSNQTLVF